MKKMLLALFCLSLCSNCLPADETESLPPSSLLQIGNFDAIFDTPVLPEGELNILPEGQLYKVIPLLARTHIA